MTVIPCRRALSFLVILTALSLGIKADVGHAETGAADKYWAQSLSIAGADPVLPRRTQPAIHIKSAGLSALDVTIFHISEDDLLGSQFDEHTGTPANGAEIWHKKFDLSAPAGETSDTAIDILQAVGPLKTGAYDLVVQDAGTHPSPRMRAMKMFSISNLGLQAFTGKEGITAQVRLLSTLLPAPGVDVALIADNNREIARARSDNQGFVRFDAVALGQKHAAALYAYGADGEFTPLTLSAYTAPKVLPKAWLEVQKIDGFAKGFAWLRDSDGNAVSQPGLYAVLQRDGDNGIAAAQTLADTAGGAFSFDLPIPKLAGHWGVSVYNKDNTLLAQRALDEPAPAAQTVTPPQAVAPDTPIVISPGRRAFQPGAPADIFVQPPFDADMNFIIATDTVTAGVDQHVGKEGTAMQVPMPNTPTGAYVIASAFGFADKDGSRIAQLTNTAWLDADKGDRRLGVKLDAPESAAPGSQLQVGVSLTNFDNQPAFVSLAVLPADGASFPDPQSYFLGQTPLSIKINNSYGGNPAASAPDQPLPSGAIAMPLLFTAPVAVDANGNATLPITLPATPTKLRLYVISWSASKLGLGASDLTLAGSPVVKSSAPQAVSKPWESETVSAGASRKMTFHEAFLSTSPILAAPVSVDKSGAATFIGPNDPNINALIASTLSPLKDDKLLQTAYILHRLQAMGAAIPEGVMQPLLDKVSALAASATLSKDRALFADFILLSAGTKDKQEVGAMLAADPRAPKTVLGYAALAALDGAVGDEKGATDNAAKALTAPNGNRDDRLFALLLLNEAKQPLTAATLKALGIQYPMTPSGDPLIRLALAFAAGITPSDAGPYKIRLNGSDATANGYLSLARDPKGPPLLLVNPNATPLYIIERQ
jgi:hypothetical protein